jgi:glyoxylate reductase
VRTGKWKTWGPKTLLGTELNGATLGIVGLGRIGKAVARRAAGFDMRLLAYSRHLTSEDAASVNAQRVQFDELLRESDFVSLHCPLTPETRHLMNRDTLAKMKPTAVLINVARGPVVDQKALYDALKKGVIGGAALDVTDPEPMLADDPLLTLSNVTIVPHIGSATIWTRDQMATMAADNLIAGLKGEPLPNQIRK